MRNRELSLKRAAQLYPEYEYIIVANKIHPYELTNERPSQEELFDKGNLECESQVFDVIPRMSINWYSNCLIEAIKAKIRLGKQAKLIHISAKDFEVYCPHWMWLDLRDGNIYDFCAVQRDEDKWWNLFLFNGHIRVVPHSTYERWCREKLWK